MFRLRGAGLGLPLIPKFSTAVVIPRYGRFYAPADRGFLNGVEPARAVRCAGSSKSSGSRPRVSTGNRGIQDGELVRAVSHQFQQGCFFFHSFEGVLTPRRHILTKIKVIYDNLSRSYRRTGRALPPLGISPSNIGIIQILTGQ